MENVRKYVFPRALRNQLFGLFFDVAAEYPVEIHW